MKRYYLFEGPVSFKSAEAAVASSLMEQCLCLIGYGFELVEQDGNLLMYSNGTKKGYTSSGIASKVTFEGEPIEAPVKKATEFGVVAANEMVIYKTNNGSMFAFVPLDAKLQVV